MQDRPTAEELIEAIADWLEQDLVATLGGRDRFQARVAVNALRILQRECAHEEETVATELQRLQALLGDEEPEPPELASRRARVRELNRRLCTQIRSGRMDERWDEVLDAVQATVSDKLRIASPGYAGTDQP